MKGLKTRSNKKPKTKNLDASKICSNSNTINVLYAKTNMKLKKQKNDIVVIRGMQEDELENALSLIENIVKFLKIASFKIW